MSPEERAYWLTLTDDRARLAFERMNNEKRTALLALEGIKNTSTSK
jgi:hypothetical protein